MREPRDIKTNDVRALIPDAERIREQLRLNQEERSILRQLLRLAVRSKDKEVCDCEILLNGGGD